MFLSNTKLLTVFAKLFLMPLSPALILEYDLLYITHMYHRLLILANT